MALERLGEPLTAAYAVANGTARLFQHGLTVKGPGVDVIVSFAFPMPGRPSLSTTTSGNTEPFGPDALNVRLDQAALTAASPLIQKALAGRVGLLPTGQRESALPLEIGPIEALSPSARGDAATSSDSPSHGVTTKAPALKERQLYDVAVLAEAGWQRVAPHAVYHRTQWSDFGLAHISDMHVARRIDRFRDLLAKAGRAEAAGRLYNWNDRFRGFVKYANHLHSIGVLDVIVATGDLYDYIFEDDDDPNGGGNVAFLRQLILGEAPGPHFPDVEELRVPLFVVPGNHDYRRHPYKLIFDAQIRLVDLGTFGGVDKDVQRIRNFSGYHLVEADAITLTNLLDGKKTSSVPNLTAEEAARMIDFDAELKTYKALLADRGSYIVRLGQHRIAMIDSKHDVGTVTEFVQAALLKVGLGNEDESTFVGGAPNCAGVSADELRAVAEELGHIPDHGLFLVGLHAPLFNMWNCEYPYFFRETQRAMQPGQIPAYLARMDQKAVSPLTPIEKQVAARHPSFYLRLRRVGVGAVGQRVGGPERPRRADRLRADRPGRSRGLCG